MGEQKSIKLHAKRLFSGFVGLIWLISVLSCNLSTLNLGDPSNGLPTLEPTPTLFFPTTESTAYFVPTQAGSTSTPAPTLTKAPPIMYDVQSGDSLSALAARFGVQPADIRSPDPISPHGLLNIGQLLIIPNTLTDTGPTTLLLPDSEVVYSPSTLDFDIDAYVKQAGGYLKNFLEYNGYGNAIGSQDVLQVAIDNSVNPRLLLGLLEYQAHWVFGSPQTLADSDFPIEKNMYQNIHGLFNELSWAARILETGYYGWRDGSITSVTFPDGSHQRIAPQSNAGSAALQYLFAKLYNRPGWNSALYSTTGFLTLYDKMFGNVWTRAEAVEPLFPPDIAQPLIDLPFYPGIVWSFSGGPHPAWGDGSAMAAVDFAPGSMEGGCVPSEAWVLAPAAGVVVRSTTGIVALDLDGDGREQTGWVLFFLHLRTDGRAYLGQRVNKDDPIGHPSCEGGNATGTHVHIARKYNGEWIPADGPLPFVLGGWQVHAGDAVYKGTLTKDGKTITADTMGSSETTIIRPKP